MALCHITGTVQLPDGTNAAGRILVFKRNPETVVAQSGHGIVPDEIAVKVAADGTVDFKLYTGNYIGFLRNQRQGNERVFKFPVPEAATALFQDILQAVDPVDPLPSWLTEAFEARDDALEAELAAEAAAAAAAANAAVVKPQFDSVAHLQADTAMTDATVPVGGTVSVNGVGGYVRVASGGDIVTAGGLRFKAVGIGAIRLSQIGVSDGDDATSAIQKILKMPFKDVIIDRSVSYSAASGVNIFDTDMASNVIFEGSGFIDANSIDNATSQSLIVFRGTKKDSVLAASGSDMVVGRNYIVVSDSSGINIGDIIHVKTSKYFNGVLGVSGFSPCNVSDYGIVSRVNNSINTVYIQGAFCLGAINSEITEIDVYSSKKNPSVVNPKVKGPGRNGGVFSNGFGSKAFRFIGCSNASVVGEGYINGFVGHAIIDESCVGVRVDGVTFDSLEDEQTTQSYYGHVSNGSKIVSTTNCSGYNVRRVADTGTNNVSIMIEQHQLHGDTCNGSAAGTHHGYIYNFSDISSINCETPMTIRSKRNKGARITSICDKNPLMLGANEAAQYDEVSYDYFDIYQIDVSGSDPSTPKGNAIRLNGNGRYNLHVSNMSGYTEYGIQSRAARIEAASVVIEDSDGGGVAASAIRLSGQKILKCIDIKASGKNHVSRTVDVGGTSEQSTPANNIKIHDCVNEGPLGMCVGFNASGAGYIDARSCSLTMNTNSFGSANDTVAVGSRGMIRGTPEAWGNTGLTPADTSTLRQPGYMPIVATVASDTSELPAGMTVSVGDRISSRTVTAGSYPEYICTNRGTTGTLSGVTASTTNGSPVVTLTGSGVNVGIGMYLTITDAGIGRAVVVSSSGNSFTLGSNATSTQSAAAVTYAAPTFKGLSLIQA